MRFSIVTVTYNNFAGLLKTRESIRTQTFRDFEWIVVDGGSSDGTRQHLDSWQTEMAAMVSEKDRGPYDGMNKGLVFARGEYVLFINAGDALAGPDVLVQLDGVIALHPADFIFGDSFEEQADGEAYYKKARAPFFRWWGMFTHHQAMIYRRDFLHTLQPVYDLRFKVGADLDLTWRIFKKTRSTCQVDFAIARCERAGISTRQASEARSEQLLMRQEHGKCFALFNVMIMMAQWATWELRQRSPGIYKFVRLRGRISEKN